MLVQQLHVHPVLPAVGVEEGQRHHHSARHQRDHPHRHHQRGRCVPGAERGRAHTHMRQLAPMQNLIPAARPSVVEQVQQHHIAAPQDGLHAQIAPVRRIHQAQHLQAPCSRVRCRGVPLIAKQQLPHFRQTAWQRADPEQRRTRPVEGRHRTARLHHAGRTGCQQREARERESALPLAQRVRGNAFHPTLRTGGRQQPKRSRRQVQSTPQRQRRREHNPVTAPQHAALRSIGQLRPACRVRRHSLLQRLRVRSSLAGQCQQRQGCVQHGHDARLRGGVHDRKQRRSQPAHTAAVVERVHHRHHGADLMRKRQAPARQRRQPLQLHQHTGHGPAARLATACTCRAILLHVHSPAQSICCERRHSQHRCDARRHLTRVMVRPAVRDGHQPARDCKSHLLERLLGLRLRLGAHLAGVPLPRAQADEAELVTAPDAPAVAARHVLTATVLFQRLKAVGTRLAVLGHPAAALYGMFHLSARASTRLTPLHLLGILLALHHHRTGRQRPRHTSQCAQCSVPPGDRSLHPVTPRAVQRARQRRMGPTGTAHTLRMPAGATHGGRERVSTRHYVQTPARRARHHAHCASDARAHCTLNGRPGLPPRVVVAFIVQHQQQSIRYQVVTVVLRAARGTDQHPTWRLRERRAQIAHPTVDAERVAAAATHQPLLFIAHADRALSHVSRHACCAHLSSKCGVPLCVCQCCHRVAELQALGLSQCSSAVLRLRPQMTHVRH
mmetsp:Transcript_27678/g.89057  ORF Transcript_27678/g.89057 Transcript_27678/m.89057 type:complete len:728 (+) Transcript_27678:1508-3691(+)